MIACGDYDVVMTGGADSMINPFQMAGFCLLGALSSRSSMPQSASRPFDADRDGFVLGEGACMFVFEDYEHAKARGATIIGEICGYGVTESAYRITDLHPEGRGVIESMETALKDAGISPDQVGYINAHGTSTPLGDEVELRAIERLVGAHADKVVMSSTKSAIGHLLGAAGAIEAVFSILAIRDGIAPATLNLDDPSVETAIDLVPHTPRKRRIDVALSNSFGFGGTNASLVFRRFAA